MVERTLILCAVAGVIVLLVLAGRAFVAARKRYALAAAPLLPVASSGKEREARASGSIQVLAFSTPHCQQCRLLQKPALEEVAAQAEQVEILAVDALQRPELAERYGILTVPSTVVLKPDGRASAVNFGYASARQLLEQIEVAGASLASI
jgi:thioredoxin 1